MTVQRQGTDYRLTFADGDLVWAEERRPGLPVVRWPDGTLCEPLILWFGWSSEVDRVAISSMRVEAYALRDWFAFMESQNRQWDDPDDGLLRMWRATHDAALKTGAISGRQVERKIDVVFEFYKLVHLAIPLDPEGNLRLAVVDLKGRVGGRALTSKTSPTGKVAWSGSRRIGSGRSRRPTPDVQQVDKVLRWLRSDGGRISAVAGRDALLRGERDWLIGRCMVDGGLRAEEAARLSVAALVSALVSEGCLSAGATLHNFGLGDQKSTTTVLAGLDRLADAHRRHVYVEIVGKGGKRRHAPFPIDLVRDIVVVGLAGVRRAQIHEWRRTRPKAEFPPNVFLSFKTRRSLDPGSISDRMKQAFNGAGIDGSGHRLRAHYATTTAALMWDECFALNGYKFDQTVVNLVMERLAEALGHSQVTTTVRHYVDMALLRHFGPEARDRTTSLRSAWETLVRNQKGMSQDKIRLLSELTEALGRLPEGSELQEVLAMALEDRTLTHSPAESAKPTLRTPRLQVVRTNEP